MITKFDYMSMKSALETRQKEVLLNNRFLCSFKKHVTEIEDLNVKARKSLKSMFECFDLVEEKQLEGILAFDIHSDLSSGSDSIMLLYLFDNGLIKSMQNIVNYMLC